VFQMMNPILSDFKYKYFQDFSNHLLYSSKDRLYLRSTLSPHFIGSSFAPIQVKTIDKYVQEMKKVKSYLDTIGIKLLVLIIPNKATVETPIIDLLDHQHLQLIQTKLKAESISSVDIYAAFKGKSNLYFKSDSHWNKNGVQIALSETVKKLSQFGQK
jgi:hypothetical protein